ncbi:glutamate racemase [Leptotrichia sp. OH3620_COT-345]|uniref:glutamate racemase n=1 Tax=Leptotrichia sp. OH3620_COT-345 TaxID=2491048 RepID=UPI000F650164|nr:glutamate racemase [Leptotrichia sp. OH3620_COT-345]RRD39952.1 glutamate racemase [Leptotrichia sp. OH3620_COT-345]
MAIGIFDSGVGGLTVLKEIRKVLPNEKIYYLGDTARVPYGEKTKELIIRYSKQITEFLLEKNTDVIVVACNTATSLALEELNRTFKIPIIGVVDAGVKTALDTTKNSKIGVIGTKATIHSKKYEIEIKKRNSKMEVYSKPCPLFVPVIEEGIVEGEIVNQLVKMYLDEFEGKIDSLILGCTHYPLLKSTIKNIYPDIEIVDPAKETATDLKKILISKNLMKNDGEKGFETKYYVTDGQEKFRKIGTMFLNEKINCVELVKL